MSTFPRYVARAFFGPVAAIIVLCWPVVTAAQQGAEKVAPPTPTSTGSPKPWLGYLILCFLAIIVISISLLPSKRSHQD